MKDLTGHRVGKWLVLKFSHKNTAYADFWVCQCDCQSPPKQIRGVQLRSGRSTNCGCNRKASLAAVKTIHGLSKNTAYSCWKAMLTRCKKTSEPTFHLYKGKGITVCDRWQYGEDGLHPFACFLADIGNRPSSQHSIERINGNLGYEPNNCKWATHQEQHNNTSSNVIIEYNGHAHTRAEWARQTNISYVAIKDRLQRGWSIEKALTTPTGPYHKSGKYKQNKTY